MGSTESSEGRRVSFGMDEEERVRVLQGIRLSENVVNRMKDSSQPSKVGQLTFPPAPPHSTFGTSKDPEKVENLAYYYGAFRCALLTGRSTAATFFCERGLKVQIIG
ncbi:Coiled-coil-helix-coiled-coil-helix domain-containing protein 6 [Pteropus alecto]|uniref:Coiled-coil-helix-coiled-coil-helix domain-containing protein 6 n=1 Tax=Pteropus alecto TaxID=9402 RepID=L5KQQ6_PTEAL|nr:Coiled-coil-helix-coiled-coil-helix domain-containing protein 6 [Pteropus alecto]